MTDMTALALVDPQALIMKALDQKVDVETIERLVALAKDVRAIQAKEAWLDAMAQFKAKVPPIYKSKMARMRNYSYKFAPLDEICTTIDPIMAEVGLTYRWTTPKIEADKVTVACLVSHRLGHSESSGDLEMPLMGAVQRQEGGEGGANAAQRVGISLTYAKRYSLLAIMGLAPEEDDDAGPPAPTGDEGQGRAEDQLPLPGQGVITAGQANRFYAIARGSKPVAWTDDQIHDLLTSHKLNAVAEIPVAKYDAIIEVLKKGPGAK